MERLILRNKIMKSNFYKLLFGAPKCNAPLECCRVSNNAKQAITLNRP